MTQSKLTEQVLTECEMDAIAELQDRTFTARKDRERQGRSLRKDISRSNHALWLPPVDRVDPIQIVQESSVGRIPELIPIRYARMLQSPFAFFRGTSGLMAHDLASTARTGIYVQACGDCHLLNFGAFATPERNLMFDVNDFDETLPAPWEWDIKRLATSIVLLARENGFKPKVGIKAAAQAVVGYRSEIREMAHLSVLETWYKRVDWPDVIKATSDVQSKQIDKMAMKKTVQRHEENYYLPKLVHQVNGVYKIKDNPPLVFHAPIEDRRIFLKSVRTALAEYRGSLQEDRQTLLDRFKLADLAIKVVGIGSVGTFCAIALFLSRDDEPLLLQIKEARSSVLAPYAGKSRHSHNGKRVIAGQRLIQAASDIFLGWTTLSDNHYYVRQLRDMKLKLEPELWNEHTLIENARMMGAVLAQGHARSGDAAVIGGYLGSGDEFDQAIAAFAVQYADQAEADHDAFRCAAEQGRLGDIADLSMEESGASSV